MVPVLVAVALRKSVVRIVVGVLGRVPHGLVVPLAEQGLIGGACRHGMIVAAAQEVDMVLPVVEQAFAFVFL